MAKNEVFRAQIDRIYPGQDRPIVTRSEFMEQSGFSDHGQVEPGGGLVTPGPAIGSADALGVRQAPAVVIPQGEVPWGIFEQDGRVDQCDHVWELCYLKRPTARGEYVVRCHRCYVPRCGDSDAPNPCMLRRHHHRPLPAGVEKHIHFDSILGQQLWTWTLDPMPDNVIELEEWLDR